MNKFDYAIHLTKLVFGNGSVGLQPDLIDSEIGEVTSGAILEGES